ncbi:hypothetical protein EJ05DRAFT_307831 [Pseudovirgaria hyperparasitica]|uniref:Azaphilone pigments biosynthesis cluster protein L N-terminal domain-containing protein n=1 Tax=Pseudovirgaria hyperparasitica TaxID=470096 RepID=A0A6A6WA51_9PEZI|nr:uncharacterized protein EJ05DRAFT_307831 [Pseudovirgaria hyperparasitica]KAF2759732.1 hypothetical protein EJ05DRAFT_307831 [Pseudovirgaria hyperparasitica]
MEAIAAVGVAASIVQLAGAGLQLSVILYEYVDSVSGADKRIKAIARDVELTSAVIQELGHTFSQNGTAQVMTASSIQTAESAVKECRYVFDELEAIVARSKDSRMAKFTMPFKDSKIQLLRANLDRWKSTLQLLMQALLHAQMVRNNDQDRAEVLRQRKELKRLIEAKKAAIKRYEDTMKATSSSEDSTLVEDLEPPERMQPGPKAMPSLGIKTFTAFVSSLAVPNKDNANHNDLENLNRDLDLNASVDQEGNTMSIDKTLTTPGVGSPKLLRTGRDKRGLITNESLALCIQHIQSLLQNIEVVESQLDQYAGQTTQTIEAEMQLQAAYAKTRDALDTIIDGTEKHSSTNKIKYNQRASSCGYCDNRGILCIHVGIEARSKGHKASTRLAYMRGCRTCRADRRKVLVR